MKTYLGIDAGNTGVKAVLFDAGGRELARARCDTGAQALRRGRIERDLLARAGQLCCARVWSRVLLPGASSAVSSTSEVQVCCGCRRMPMTMA